MYATQMIRSTLRRTSNWQLVSQRGAYQLRPIQKLLDRPMIMQDIQKLGVISIDNQVDLLISTSRLPPVIIVS